MTDSSSGRLPFAHGGPPLRGVLRAVPEDFFVDEDLGFEPDGAGEHVFLRVEKRGANTDWVAKELARFAGVAPAAVAYSGLKDRHALTRQTFSVHLPGKTGPDWTSLRHPEFTVLAHARHGRKLKRGAHGGNFFGITLREVTGDRPAAEQVVAAVAAAGVPNYFGEQRFGHGGANVERALRMFAGQRVPHHERAMLLSAARSHLFNLVLAARVARGDWNRPLEGDVWMLAGTHSIFGPEPLSAELAVRCSGGDIAPTGPLWGVGELRTAATAMEIETSAARSCPELTAGLDKAGLRQERRGLVLRTRGLSADWISDTGLSLRFYLQSGSYATVLIREIVETDSSIRSLGSAERDAFDPRRV